MTVIVRQGGSPSDEDVEALVNMVKCEGFIGEGVALQFRKRSCDHYLHDHKVACKEKATRPGRVRACPIE